MDKIWLRSCPADVPAEIDYTRYRSLVHLLEEAFAWHLRQQRTGSMLTQDAEALV